MAQLNDTLVNGDLRVNGKIYGIITSADSATNASNLGSTAASDFALKNGNYSSNGLVAKSASTAATANAAKWTEKSDDRTYRVAFSEDAQFYYSKQFNYNAGTQTLCAKNISSVNITGTVNGNLSGSAASALTSKSALSAGSASTAEKATWVSKTDNRNYNVAFSLDNAFNYRNTLTFNPSSNTLSSTNITTVTLSGTTVKGVTISGTNITAATTVRGTNLSGTNISGATKTMTVDNLISSATRSLPTVNNNTITISTGASPATASFTLNQNSNKTITLGSMALKASGDFSLTSHNHSYTLSGNGTAVNVSAGVNFKPSGSNIKFYVSGNDIYISAKNDNTTYTSLNSINTNEYKALTSTSANSRNPNAHELSSHTNFSTYFNATSANSALTSKSALSAGSAKNAEWARSADYLDGYAAGAFAFQDGNYSSVGGLTAKSARGAYSASTANYSNSTNTAIKVNSAIYLQDFGDTSRFVQVSWGGQNVSLVKIDADRSLNNGSRYLAAFYTNDGSTTSNIGKIKPVDVSNVQVASADTVDGLHVATGTIGSATNYLYFC